MTKREICERLLILYADVNSIQTQIGVWNEPLDDAERDIRKAILDLVESVEEKDSDHFADAGKMMEKAREEYRREATLKALNLEAAPKAEEAHPGIIVDPSGKNPPRCLKCGRDAEVVHYMGDEWVLCPKCGCAYRIKSGKDEK